jgi:hypothetical protein
MTAFGPESMPANVAGSSTSLLASEPVSPAAADEHRVCGQLRQALPVHPVVSGRCAELRSTLSMIVQLSSLCPGDRDAHSYAIATTRTLSVVGHSSLARAEIIRPAQVSETPTRG